MATTDYDFRLTRRQIIERALRLIGAIDFDGAMSAEQEAAAAIALNAMVKEWQNENVFLWTLVQSSVSLAASTKTYAIEDDPAIIDISSAFTRDGSDDTPLDVISWTEYFQIPDKDSPGVPTCVAIDYQNPSTLYVWPVPTDASLDLHYLGIAKLKDMDTDGAYPDFDARWVNALTWGLAVDLAPEYSLPIAERQSLARDFDTKFARARKGNVPRVTSDVVCGAHR